jgi:membrane protease YdiL (CAAX protease family)
MVSVPGEENPFERIKARGLLPWALIGFILIVILIAIIEALSPLNEELGTDLVTLFLYFWLSLWVYRKLRRANVDVRRLFGKAGGIRLVRLLGLAILLLVFSAGIILIVDYGLSRLWPGLLAWINRTHSTSATAGLTWALDMTMKSLMLVVLAPLVEETLFRGILLNRWAVKWGLTKAILISAGAFAILHVDLVGAFIFGVCMALLYKRTSTLWAPIIVHASYNGVVAAFMLLRSGSDTRTDNAESYESFPWFGLAYVVLTSPLVLAFIYKNRPSRGATAPYTIEAPLGPPVESVDRDDVEAKRANTMSLPDDAGAD